MGNPRLKKTFQPCLRFGGDVCSIMIEEIRSARALTIGPSTRAPAPDSATLVSNQHIPKQRDTLVTRTYYVN